MRISGGKRELEIDPPWMNTAGTLGFSDETAHQVDFSRMGAFVTHPVSRAPRRAARGDRLVDFPGGFLLHTGLPNPGLTSAIRAHRHRWRRMPVPVIVHLMVDDADDLHQMLLQLEVEDSISAVEVGVSGISPSDIARWLAPTSASELPVIAQVGLGAGQAGIAAAVEAGAAAVTLTPPRGAAQHQGSPTAGRQFGPALWPTMLRATADLAPQAGRPLIVSGGVRNHADIMAAISAGASAVQVDYALWTNLSFPEGDALAGR